MSDAHRPPDRPDATGLDATRPDVVVLVAGTGTEVGKTWVGAQVLRTLAARGHVVHARKPAQSFEPGDVETGRTDAQLLAAATGEDPCTVCPEHRWYPVPMAPPMAADALGRPPIHVAELLAELSWPPGPGDGGDADDATDLADAAASADSIAGTVSRTVGLVETAGGVRSPLAVDGDTVTLAGALHPDLVVVVADAGLGTINAVLLTVAALTGHPVAVLLNRFSPADDLHERNRAWLTGCLPGPVLVDVEALATVILHSAPEPAPADAHPPPPAVDPRSVSRQQWRRRPTTP